MGTEKGKSERQSMGSAIKAALVERGLTITECAPLVGLTYDQLSNLVNGRTTLRDDVANKLRKALRKPDGWPFATLRDIDGSALPMMDLEVLGGASAGKSGSAADGDSISVPANMVGPRRKGLTVDGDSLAPHVWPGETLVFEPTLYAKNRKVHALLCDGQMITKQLLYKSGVVWMHSFNAKHEDELLPDDCEIQGFAVGLYAVRGTEIIIRVNSNGLEFEDFS